MQIDVPFYSNTPDDTHCFQASLRMVVKYFWPVEEYTWKELELITAKAAGLWTWPTAGMLWLQKKGAQVVSIESFNYETFSQDGGAYLLDFLGREVGGQQISHSNIQQEVALAKQAIQKIHIETRVPKISDISKLISDGYLVICNVNSSALNGDEGYVGHFVVIVGVDESYLWLHDPGLPAQKNRKVNIRQFEKAWGFPHDGAKNILAVKGV